MEQENGRIEVNTKWPMGLLRDLTDTWGKGDWVEDNKSIPRDIVGTPERIKRFYEEFLNPKPFKFTTFESAHDELVISDHIPFYSLCEHHLLPFFGTAKVGYLPKDRIVGISKLARCVDWYARRLQTQERITTQVAHLLQDELDCNGVAVVLQARHMCQEMRGINKPGIVTKTSCMLGRFKEDLNLRNEFLKL